MRSINDERQNHPDLVYFWVAHEDFIDESSESLLAIRANASEGGKMTNLIRPDGFSNMPDAIIQW